MNKEEFLRQLELLLSDISEEERADAIAFYRSYFEDAGEANEASILVELESPQKVAESIRKNLGAEENGTGEKADEGGTLVVNPPHDNGDGAGNAYGGAYMSPERSRREHTATVVLAVIVAVLTSPIWLALLAVLVGLLVGVAGILIGVAAIVVAVMAALVVTGFLFLGIGISFIAAGNPAVGAGLLGGGLIVLAVGVLAVLLVVWMFGMLLPWVCRGIWNLCKKPFHKRKERAAV